MGIHKPINAEVVAHNQQQLEDFGRYACEQNAFAAILISVTRDGKIVLNAHKDRRPEDIALILETLSTQMRAGNKNLLQHN